MSESALEYHEKHVSAAQIFRDIAMDLLEATAYDLSRPIPHELDRTNRAQAVRRERRYSLRWLDHGEARMGFAKCCDALDVPAEALRRKLLEDPLDMLAKIREITARRAVDLGPEEQDEINPESQPGPAEQTGRNAFFRPK